MRQLPEDIKKELEFQRRYIPKLEAELDEHDDWERDHDGEWRTSYWQQRCESLAEQLRDC